MYRIIKISLKEKLMFLLGLQSMEWYSRMNEEKCTSSRFIVTSIFILKITNLVLGETKRGGGGGRQGDGVHSLQHHK